MMSPSPFNSTLEIATRIAVILAARPHLARNERTLAAIDLLTTNRGDYTSEVSNLHGHSMFPASLASRLDLIRCAIPFAVTRGLIVPHVSDEEARYMITLEGRAFAANLTSPYFWAYNTMLISTLAFVDSRTPAQVLDVFKQPQDLTAEGGNQS